MAYDEYENYSKAFLDALQPGASSAYDLGGDILGGLGDFGSFAADYITGQTPQVPQAPQFGAPGVPYGASAAATRGLIPSEFLQNIMQGLGRVGGQAATGAEAGLERGIESLSRGAEEFATGRPVPRREREAVRKPAKTPEEKRERQQELSSMIMDIDDTVLPPYYKAQLLEKVQKDPNMKLEDFQRMIPKAVRGPTEEGVYKVGPGEVYVGKRGSVSQTGGVTGQIQRQRQAMQAAKQQELDNMIRRLKPILEMKEAGKNPLIKRALTQIFERMGLANAA